MYDTDDEPEITLENVNEVLAQIENKYSPVKNISANSEIEESLIVLTKELDSIGIPALNLSQTPKNIFKELISSTRSLVQIHRNTLAQMKDTNIASQRNNIQNNHLYKVIECCQSKVNAYENKNAELKNRIDVLEDKLLEYKKKEANAKNEMDKIKRYQKEQNNDFIRQFKKLSEENKKLIESNTDVKPHSKDEVMLNFIGKYKRNEEIYKTTINQLEANNRQLVRDIIDLKCKKNSTSD
ncbi:uncharacterized protein LOC114331945 isoform X2 [Diabrotica virgifera virgifera]|nr:uncharacterized protein LOC114331945 isoform X2 [Diabrotica virgifera virgifera]XP_028137437.1 uncharacterized protein LOC114331945 isoform X2 [Diabrotica virgifera virgifera]